MPVASQRRLVARLAAINKMPAEQPRMATTNGSQPSATGIVRPIVSEVPLAVKTGTDMAQIMRIAAAMATSPAAARSPAPRTRAEGGRGLWAGVLAVCWYVVGPSSAKPCVKDGCLPKEAPHAAQNCVALAIFTPHSGHLTRNPPFPPALVCRSGVTQDGGRSSCRQRHQP